MSSQPSNVSQLTTIGPTTPPGPQTSPTKLPSTFPEQTAQLVEVLKATNSFLTERSDAERSRYESCNESCLRLEREKAVLQEQNAQLRGENAKLNDHLIEVRELRKSDRARHAIVAIIVVAVISISGGMIDTTDGETQLRWLIVQISAVVLLAVYSLLVYSDELRLGLVQYGICKGLFRILFGKEGS